MPRVVIPSHGFNFIFSPSIPFLARALLHAGASRCSCVWALSTAPCPLHATDELAACAAVSHFPRWKLLPISSPFEGFGGAHKGYSPYTKATHLHPCSTLQRPLCRALHRHSPLVCLTDHPLPAPKRAQAFQGAQAAAANGAPRSAHAGSRGRSFCPEASCLQPSTYACSLSPARLAPRWPAPGCTLTRTPPQPTPHPSVCAHAAPAPRGG